ncbi:MAG: LPP20 family lipoprotein [Treponema sp.]|nr:LPP20 family lipoprotein [Treponema sp.]
MFKIAICFLLIFSVCEISNAQQNNRRQPDWVRDPYRRYDRQANVAAVGLGSDRQTAERNALGNLISFFGQSIFVEEAVSVIYQETVQSGAAARWSETTAINSNIITTASMENLIGAEIGEVWFDGSRTYYAIAFMNKRNAIQIYSQMLHSNQVIINNLINIPSEQRLTLEAVARYNFAAVIADINASYANLLSLLGDPAHLQRLTRGNEYRLEAQNIIRAIPINITVNDDRESRIQSAFAKVLTGFGFRISANNSRYTLRVNVRLSQINFPNDPNRFVLMELNANLTDSSTGAILLPFSLNNREGHSTAATAENRAFLSAERIIEAEYKELLTSFFSRLLPD